MIEKNYRDLCLDDISIYIFFMKMGYDYRSGV